MNYCLSNSSVGFYQVAKLFCIPLTLLCEVIFGMQQEIMTYRLVFSLMLILLGMYMVIKEEVSTNFNGFIWGLSGVICTAASQVFFGPLKKGLGLDAYQMLFHSTPWLTFGSFIFVPIFENTTELIAFQLTPDVVFTIILTCAVAVAFNVSNYVVLGEISPLSYNIMGHVKTIVIITVGSYLFGTMPSTNMVIGMIAAIFGVLFFTLEKDRQTSEKSKPAVVPTRSLPSPSASSSGAIENSASSSLTGSS
jgi:solute carrier family 35, member E3